MTELQSIVTCPHCGHRQAETMPTDACQFFYDCRGCGELMRPKPGSYGSVPCPPIQEAREAGQQAACCTG